MLPLTTADLLAHAIVGLVLENLDMERLVCEVGQAVAQRILGNNESVDDVARELHEKLLLRNESTKKVVIESIYRESEESKHNVQVFLQAPSLTEARPLLRRVGIFHDLFLFLSSSYHWTWWLTLCEGTWHPLYRQVPLCPHEPIQRHLLLFSLLRPQIFRLHELQAALRLFSITLGPAQGRD